MRREYCDVVRVNCNVRMHTGYKFVAWDESYTLATLQYARDMTLTRGRILYEVWDFYQGLLLGYFVPEQIFSEALANRHGASLAEWTAFPAYKRSTHQHTFTLIVDCFPRIPRLTAKIISASMYLKGQRASLSSVEVAVVEHVKYCWTSYEHRVLMGPDGRQEAFRAVKPRMRAVLKGWLPTLTDLTSLAGFYRKYELLDEWQDQGECNALRERKPSTLRSVLQWFGGAEVPGNLISQPHPEA